MDIIMQNDIIGSYAILDGSSIDAQKLRELDIAGVSIYEVIRVIDEIPLFLENHIMRLENSAKNIGSDISCIIKDINADIYKLIELNSISNMNVKILVFGFEEKKLQYALYFIESFYPSDELYKTGIDVITFNAERNNPNTKIVNLSLKERISVELQKHNAYEALLVNNSGHITEGSKSNVFFVKDETVFTALDSTVLVGITRNFVVDICKQLGLDLRIQNVDFNILKNIDGLFITGTSPKILPIRRVDSYLYESSQNKVIKQIILSYNKIIEEYISTPKKNR